MAFKMKGNPMKLGSIASKSTMKLKDKVMKMKKEAAMKMKKESMAKMKEAMAKMKKDPMMMKKGSPMEMKKGDEAMKMKKGEAMKMKKGEPMNMKKGEAMKMKKGQPMKQKMNMVKGPDGKMVPDFAVDGKGANDMKKSSAKMKKAAPTKILGKVVKAAKKAHKGLVKGGANVVKKAAGALSMKKKTSPVKNKPTKLNEFGETQAQYEQRLINMGLMKKPAGHKTIKTIGALKNEAVKAKMAKQLAKGMKKKSPNKKLLPEVNVGPKAKTDQMLATGGKDVTEEYRSKGNKKTRAHIEAGGKVIKLPSGQLILRRTA